MSVAESSPASVSPAGKTSACPRCHSREPWGMSSWCPHCGYYPSVVKDDLEDDSWKDRIVEEEEAGPESVWEAIPAWFWVTVAGMTAIMVFSVAIRRTWPDENSPRGLVALTQLVLGLGLFLWAHGVASYHAIKADPRVTFTDVLLSWFSVWQCTIDNLPATCKRIFGIVWGLTAMLAAVTVIGGIDYSAPFRTEATQKSSRMASEVVGAVVDAANAQAPPAADIEQALAQVQDPTKAAAAAGAGTLQDSVQQLSDRPADEQLTEAVPVEGGLKTQLFPQKMYCVVYGVVVNEQNQPTSLLFAGDTRGSDQHVAEIAAASLSGSDFHRIAARLQKAVRRAPVVPSRYQAVWVEPLVRCRLTFDRVAENGELVNPVFGATVVNQPGHRR